MPTSYDLLCRALEIFTQDQVADCLDYDPRQIRRWKNRESRIPNSMSPALREMLKGSAFQVEEDQTSYNPKPKFTFIDLFAGIGGTRLGFERAGGKCVFTSEWNKYACQTYRANHEDDHEIRDDITKIDEKEIPEHDVLVGGFPCQPFSLAGVSKKNSMGRAHGFACDTQGTLFFDIARILKHHRPKAFLLENVKNLRSHDKGRTFQVILKTLRDELGYTVFDKVVDAKCLVPQHRERIYMVGFAGDEDFDFNGLGFPAVKDGPKLSNILHSSDEKEENDYTEHFRGKTRVNPKYDLSDKLWNYLQAYAEKHRLKGNGFGCSVFEKHDVARTLSARYYKDGSEILIKQARKNPRRLTPRECARLMGFPNSFRIPVSDTQAYKQFGNSVVVPVIERIAKGIEASLSGNPLIFSDSHLQMRFPGLVAEEEEEMAYAIS